MNTLKLLGITLPSILLGVIMSLPVMADSATQKSADKQTEKAKVRIVLVGDSTVTDQAGWGVGFKKMLNDQAECINVAVGGRSSKSYIDEGRWEKALALKGDYVFLQFGHNDEKGKGPERETEPDTTYTANMTRYVDDVRAAGGKPILVTSLVRRLYDKNGKLPDTNLTRYVRAVRKIAEEKKVPLIELYSRSVDYFEKIGEEASVKYEPKDEKTGGPDRTHLNEQGSIVIGQIVAGEAQKVVPELAPYFKK